MILYTILNGMSSKKRSIFPECVFGWYEDVYVCVIRDDYDNAKNNR